MSALKNLFVYGSLLKGFSNNRVLGSSELLGKAVTLPKFTLIGLGSFPGVLLEGTTIITGELYQVDQHIYNAVERLEGYPSFYNRKEIEIKLIDSPELTKLAEIYFLDRDYKSYSIIDSGIWEDKHYYRTY